MKRLLSCALLGVALVSCTNTNKNLDVAKVVPGSAEDFAQNVSDLVYFGFDRFDLTAEAKAVLDAASAWLSMYSSRNATIEGHTDKRGTAEYNIGLGSRRAESVKKYLIEKGIDQSRLSTISFGKEALVSPGDTEEEHAKNRRAHIIVVQ
jgi:peptidoglycan-associated lipoprotein